MIAYRKKISLPIPPPWFKDEISWLVVQDFHATGLSGNLHKRTSDYWNYWLNFGQSNKDGSGRGGRGIGRVTFLIASSIQTVIGYTRRASDSKIPICGMTVLRPVEDDDNFLSSHAYLAASEQTAIYNLHKSSDFTRTVINAFKFRDYQLKSETGLALAIPYPHRELSANKILAASIEHFAPTLMEKKLVLNVGSTRLDSHTISSIADRIHDEFRDLSIKSDPRIFIALIKHALGQHKPNFEFDLPEVQSRVQVLNHHPNVAKVKQYLINNKPCVVDVFLRLKHRQQVKRTKVRAIIAKTPDGASSIDCFFRNGMCLPKVKARETGDLDLLLFVEDELLATYLNLCEGKAHLNLARSKEITQKLRTSHFGPPVYAIRDLMKWLPRDLREIFCEDATQPDARVFEAFFSVPAPHRKPRPGRRQPGGPDTAPVSNPKPVRISTLKKDGLRVNALATYSNWPIDLSIRIAYADGSVHPKWNSEDFDLAALDKKHLITERGCKKRVIQRNEITCHNCTKTFRLDIRGFDPKRELIVLWREISNAN